MGEGEINAGRIQRRGAEGEKGGGGLPRIDKGSGSDMVFQSLDFVSILLTKPLIQVRQIIQLKFNRKLEVVSNVDASTSRCPAMAGESAIIVAIDGVIEGDFFSFCNVSHSQNLPDAVNCLHIAGGIARMIDASLGFLHENDLAVKEVSIDFPIFWGKRCLTSNDMRIINL